MAFLTIIPKAEKALRPNQKLATSLDLSCRDNLSTLRSISSEFVGFDDFFRRICYIINNEVPKGQLDGTPQKQNPRIYRQSSFS